MYTYLCHFGSYFYVPEEFKPSSSPLQKDIQNHKRCKVAPLKALMKRVYPLWMFPSKIRYQGGIAPEPKSPRPCLL